MKDSSEFKVKRKMGHGLTLMNTELNVELRTPPVNEGATKNIGQFKMVTDDDQTPVHGVVTDGAAKIRLQLTIKYGKEALSGLNWQIIDTQALEPMPSAIRGTLMNGENPVESVPVVFNGNTAEAVYRAPENFVRWQTTEEDNDKELPYRYLQPTLDISAYFQNGGDPLTQIRLRRPPVILVHGLWGSREAWDEFEPGFNSDGLYDILRVDYSEDEEGQVRSVADHAYKLELGIIEKRKALIRQGFAATKVDVIAHSLGGLLTREYCQQYNAECQKRIRRFITIATPHFGSELADLLLVYRDDRDNFPNPFTLTLPPSTCQNRLDLFVNGVFGKLEHPIGPIKSDENPEGSAIDDLATGRLPDFIQSSTTGSRWSDPGYLPISENLSAHVIVGELPEPLNGRSLDIIILWNNILEPCGFTRMNVFGEGNDRIVGATSQYGGLMGDNTTLNNFEDHFTVRNSSETVDEIKILLNEPLNSGKFSQ
ncbi:alpha/beta hydrolase family protein [bacterium BMS3Abin10]|nr:alpha/beta hydrolase family protein [bacterium BMS3Abin10]